MSKSSKQSSGKRRVKKVSQPAKKKSTQQAKSAVNSKVSAPNLESSLKSKANGGVPALTLKDQAAMLCKENEEEIAYLVIFAASVWAATHGIELFLGYFS